MTDHFDDEYVIDRTGLVWLLVHDGGMATRADYAGITSIGIRRLELDAGPLHSLTVRTMLAVNPKI